MKKIISVSLVFALVVGAVFAEVNVGGDVFGKITPFSGSNLKDDDEIYADGGFQRVRLELNGQNEDGTAGAYLRLDKAPWWGWGTGISSSFAAIATGNVWWKPIDQFKLMIGGNGKDGFFGADGFMRWGFYQVSADGVGVFAENWKFSSSFYGGFDEDGAIVTLALVEGLEINIGIPMIARSGKFDQVYPYTHAQVAYNLDGVGKFALTYVGNMTDSAGIGYDEDEDEITFGSGNGGKFLLFADIGAIEGLGINFGLGFTLPVTEDFGGTDVTYNAPLAIGLGVNFNAGDFGVKFRLQAEIGETWKGDGDDIKGPTKIVADVYPSFAISEKITAVLSAGLDITVPDEGDSVTGWHVSPGVFIKTGWWAPSVYFAFRLESDGAKGGSGDGDAALVKWSVPIGIAFSF